jgi:ABC-type transport system involved in multi-copper enzyme maturation permease subunit
MSSIALFTIRQLVRQRFVIAAILATVALAGLTGWGFFALRNAHTARGHPISALEIKGAAAMLVILIAYLFSFVLAVAATLLASPMLSTEVASGVLLPVLARPISRSSVVLGKALGLAIVVTLYAAFAGSLEFLLVRVATGYAPPHPVIAVCALGALALAMLALTLALATRLSMIASSIVAFLCFGIAWMAGIVASFGSIYHNEALVRAGVISQLLLPTDAMWRTAAYFLEPAVMISRVQAQQWPGAFLVAAPPPPPMQIWTALWIFAVMGLAARSFSTRDV